MPFPRVGSTENSGYPNNMDAPTAPAPPVVACEGLRKSFGQVAAVDGLALEVRSGEILALLGPSGCGKTTFLRLVAGFERPDAGVILLAGAEVAGPRHHVPPERRRIGVVFQDYALFPHMTVAGNVSYGLSGARDQRDGRDERVNEMLDLVGLVDLADRYPHELSGGQQQRVALARALAPGPAVVLLDEPFSNLDAALRVHLRADTREILRAAGATAVFVTHDQEEALSFADRVAVMVAGKIRQVDVPDYLYSHPADLFVATFVGDADVLRGVSDGAWITCAAGVVAPRSPVGGATNGPATAGTGDVDVVLRPENVRLRLDGAGQGHVERSTYFGHDQLVEVTLGDGSRLRSRMGPSRLFHPGDRVSVTVVGAVTAFPVDSANAGSGGSAEGVDRESETVLG